MFKKNQNIVPIKENHTVGNDGIYIPMEPIIRKLELMRKYKIVYFYHWLTDRPEQWLLKWAEKRGVMSDYDCGIIEKPKKMPLFMKFCAWFCHMQVYEVNGKLFTGWTSQKVGDYMPSFFE